MTTGYCLPWSSALPHLVCPQSIIKPAPLPPFFLVFALIRWYFAILMCAPSPLYVSLSPRPSSRYHPLILTSFTRKKSRNGVICYGRGGSSTPEHQGKLPRGATRRLNTEKEKESVLNMSRVSCSAHPRGKNKRRG